MFLGRTGPSADGRCRGPHTCRQGVSLVPTIPKASLVWTLATIAVLQAAASPPRALALPVWDLTADWSDTANPDGAWTFRDGGVPLPAAVSAWQGLSNVFSTAQPAWTTSTTQISSLPALFKSSADVIIVHDWLPGDIVVHTQDDANGFGFGPANVVWTSPMRGTVDLSGAVWMGRDIARSNHWSLWIRGVKVSEGDIASGDPYDRATPFDFSAGTGGGAAITSVSVNVGDPIELLLERTSQFGDFVGIRFSVSASFVASVPPGAIADGLSLSAPSPNPMRSMSAIHFRLPAPSRASLAIYDVLGHRVRNLTSEMLAAGDHSVLWDGRDDRGAPAHAGVYLLRLYAGGQTRTRTLALLH